MVPRVLSRPSGWHRRGVSTILFDEKLAWEKPCGGGLTWKAWSQYPFLFDSPTPRKTVTETILTAPKSGPVKLTLDRPLLIFSRYDLNGMLLDRAQRAGARIEKTRVLSAERTASRWRLRTKTGTVEADYCIVATGARNPLRDFGTELTAGDTMARAGLLHPRRPRAHRHPISSETGGIYLDISALRPSLRGHMRQRRTCFRPARAPRTLHGTAGTFERRCYFLQSSAALPRNGARGNGTVWRARDGSLPATPPDWWIRLPARAFTTRCAPAISRRARSFSAIEANGIETAGAAYRKLLRHDFMNDLEFGSRLAPSRLSRKISFRFRDEPHGPVHAPQPEIPRRDAGSFRRHAALCGA